MDLESSFFSNNSLDITAFPKGGPAVLVPAVPVQARQLVWSGLV